MDASPATVEQHVIDRFTPGVVRMTAHHVAITGIDESYGPNDIALFSYHAASRTVTVTETTRRMTDEMRVELPEVPFGTVGGLPLFYVSMHPAGIMQRAYGVIFGKGGGFEKMSKGELLPVFVRTEEVDIHVFKMMDVPWHNENLSYFFALDNLEKKGGVFVFTCPTQKIVTSENQKPFGVVKGMQAYWLQRASSYLKMLGRLLF